MGAKDTLQELAREQGWSQDSQIELLCRFIDELLGGAPDVDLEAFLQKQADWENSQTMDDLGQFDVHVAVRVLFEKGVWMDACKLKGIDDWAVAEGLMDKGDLVGFTWEEARRLGLVTPSETRWEDL